MSEPVELIPDFAWHWTCPECSRTFYCQGEQPPRSMFCGFCNLAFLGKPHVTEIRSEEVSEMRTPYTADNPTRSSVVSTQDL